MFRHGPARLEGFVVMAPVPRVTSPARLLSRGMGADEGRRVR